MPRTGVRYDDVVESIHVLEKAGLTPSIRNIRERIGKGSLSTIAEHKREYDLASDTADREALPDPIAKGLLQGAEIYWKELTDAADAEITAIQAAADAAESALREEIDGLKGQLADTQDALGAETVAKTAIQATLEATESTRDGLQNDFNASQAEIKALSARLDEARTASDKAESTLAGQTDALREAQDTIAALKERIDQAAAKHATEQAASQSALSDATSRIESLAEDLKAAHGAVGAAELATCEQRQRADRLESAQETHLRQLAGVRREFDENRTTFSEERERLAASLAVEKALIQEKDDRIRDLKGTLTRTEQALAEALLRIVVTGSDSEVDKS